MPLHCLAAIAFRSQRALHHEYPAGYCGARVVQPLAIVRWPGEWHEEVEKRKDMSRQVRSVGGGIACASCPSENHSRRHGPLPSTPRSHPHSYVCPAAHLRLRAAVLRAGWVVLGRCSSIGSDLHASIPSTHTLAYPCRHWRCPAGSMNTLLNSICHK